VSVKDHNSQTVKADTDPVRLGIIGPGRIAASFAASLARTKVGRLVAVASRDPNESALQAVFPGARIVRGYQALLDLPEIEAVYISTPHPFHAEWSIKAAEAGKHVLTEKPAGITADEVEAVVESARRHRIFFGEAFMYRFHPQTKRLLTLIEQNVVGDVRLVRSSIGFRHDDRSPTSRHFSHELAGGGILDVGCYPVSISRQIAGAIDGTNVSEPLKVAGLARLGPTGVDETASLSMLFANGLVAELSCSIGLLQDNLLQVFGTNGRIEVGHFWWGSGKQGGTGHIKITRPDGSTEIEQVNEPRWLFEFEAEAASEAIRQNRTEFSPPGMTWADTIGNMRVLDLWRSVAGLRYDFEKRD